MDSAVVIDVEGSLGHKVAEHLADVLKAPSHRAEDASPEPVGVRLVRSAAALHEGVPLIVYVDDSPMERENRDIEREAALERLALAQRAGSRAIVLTDAGAAKRWIHHLKYEAIFPAQPIQRVFVASVPSPECDRLLGELSPALDLPVSHPDQEGDLSAEGWGRHYAAAAAGDRWLIQSASWHAVEYLAARADLVVYLPAKEVFAAQPDQQKWRTIFRAWFKRYPGIEARLLSRNVAAHSHLAPVYVLRNRDELEAFLAGLTNRPAAPGNEA